VVAAGPPAPHASAVTHYSRLARIVVDAPAETHDAEVAFWRDALGVPLKRYERFPEYHGAELIPDRLGLLTQQLGSGPARVHLDIHTNDREAEVARLVRLGATVVDVGEHWTVLRDPAGLVFCVVPDPAMDASNAREWTD
jgi:catechol 2,3-dioxygenase-like lactoylglutathione lyase family enzyme